MTLSQCGGGRWKEHFSAKVLGTAKIRVRIRVRGGQKLRVRAEAGVRLQFRIRATSVDCG